MIGNRLVLFNYLLREFGFADITDLRGKFKGDEFRYDTADISLFYQSLANRVNIPIDCFRKYDENIIRHLETINRQRAEKINLKYYQYFSLLFTERYLDEYFSDRGEFAKRVNLYKRDFYRKHGVTGSEAAVDYDPERLNLIAFWEATGSGKTFLLHFNILQYRYYIKQYNVKANHFILLTPSEQMSRQHLEELHESSVDADYYLNNKTGDHVKVIDIHKVRLEKGVITVNVDEFDQHNALFVDEGHKGNDKEEGVWRDIREKLGFNGFTFEYSATFGHISNRELQSDYSKSIIFDYSYRHFYEDRYGKDYWIHIISDRNAIDNQETRYRYLMQNLLLFAQQNLYYELHPEVTAEYQIENPLLIFVGHTVNPQAKGQQEKKENELVISDVKLLVQFFADFLAHQNKYVGWLDRLKSGNGLFPADYQYKFDFIFDKYSTGDQLYSAIISQVFNCNIPGKLELYTLRNAPGEIALKCHNSSFYFGLIYIGDVSTFKSGFDGEIEFLVDSFHNSLFESLSAKVEKPINVLIGARKFIEGWNCYRVSSIGLINFGRSEGAQIIQLFGRGVRLRGKDNSLKRTTGDGPANIKIVEKLNIFGLNADYMRRFKEDLEKEGIQTRKTEVIVPVKLLKVGEKTIRDFKLNILEKRAEIPLFRTREVVELQYDRKIPGITLNLSVNRLIVTAQHQDQNSVKIHELSDLTPFMDCIDFQRLYLDLLAYKQKKQFHNLTFQAEQLLTLLKQISFIVETDHPIEIKTLRDIENIQKIARNILEKYIERFYTRCQNVYESEYLSVKELTEEHSVFRDLDYHLEVETTDTQGNALTDIEKVLEEFKKVITDKNFPENIKDYDDGIKILNNAWFERLLFRPLLCDEQNKNYRIVNPLPNSLNEGETKFIRHLQSHIIAERGKGNYQDCNFYLLRNAGRNKGFGFYFSTSGGFYPDFLLWIVKNGKQYLTFIDPHGLRNEDEGLNSDRILLHKRIKELEKKDNIKGKVILNSFILSTGAFRDSGINWRDTPQKEEDLYSSLNSMNVYEISQYSGKMSGSGYIGLIIQKILSGTRQ
ncbi:MAG: DEAD/DEAH box helicase family protein [Candidatus Marinimicrobia bacterium]|nr:DEAD/DEAH box helicase family protein [Candidatus Neomarinimicrobiota bacterium]